MRWRADPLRLRVGECYDSGVRRWPGQELILTTDGCVVLVDRPSFTAERIDEFRTAAVRFAWVDGRHNGFLCWRFGTSPWDFLPFNPHRDTPDDMTAGTPAIEPGHTVSVAIGLAKVDEPVLAVRIVEWPEHFVSAVGATVTRLAAQRYDAETAINEANTLYLSVGAERLAQRAGVRVTRPAQLS